MQALHPERARWQALLDGKLSTTEAAELSAHLESCPECKADLEQLADPEGRFAALAQSVHGSGSLSADHGLKETISPQRVTPSTVRRGRSLSFLAPAENPGTLGRLAHFDIVEVIGEGGMGMVFRAFDTYLERFVALKVLDPQLAGDELARKRFCREARAAASINHENVVAIHQVLHEEDADLPMLVMQLVSGESLEDRLERDGRLEFREIISIGSQIAAGLAAAHAQGLVHRDVKPGNVLIEKNRTRVKITDFGLVRAVEDVRLTQTGFVGGTPLYMAPEQARGENVDHRADLFSFGGVLYAMCTGTPPFSDSSPFLILQKIIDQPHPAVRKLNPEIPDWFGNVIDRLLAKHPADRFQTADEVAEILHHHNAVLISSGEVQCVPPPKKRGRAILANLAVSSLLTLAALGLIFGFVGFPRPNSPLAGAAMLGPAPAAVTPPVAVLPGNPGPIWSLAYSPAGDHLVLGLDDGAMRVWDIAAKRVVGTLAAHRGPVWGVAYDPTGNYIATASDDGKALIWSTETMTPIASLEHPSSVRSIAFAPAGQRVVTGTRNGSVRVWDISTQRELFKTTGHAGVVVSVAWSPDGQTIASGSGDKLIKLWDAETGKERLTLAGHGGGVHSVAFSKDSRELVSGSWDKLVRLWDTSTGSLLRELKGHHQDVWCVAFSPDGKRLASGSEDHTVRLWDVESASLVETFTGQDATIYAVSFSPDGQRLASAGREGTIRIWAVPQTTGK